MKHLVNTLFAISLFASSSSWAMGASDNASKASEHSVLAVGHATASTAKVASGVVAVPLIAIGSVGSVAMASGEKLLDSATSSNTKPVDKNQPLEISEITITVQRTPAEQMAKEKK